MWQPPTTEELEALAARLGLLAPKAPEPEIRRLFRFNHQGAHILITAISRDEAYEIHRRFLVQYPNVTMDYDMDDIG